MIEGVDVSAYQKEIDWNKLAGKGIKFAIIRAGSINNVTGECWEDYYFRRNVLLGAALMPVSFYWYFRPNHSAVKQAEYFIGLLDLVKDKIGLPHVWCDIEVAGQAAVVKAFCELVNVKYPIGIYTNENTTKYLLSGDKTWMRNYPLWLADYTDPAPAPAPWSSYVMRQYATQPGGADWGVATLGLDHDRMNDSYMPPTPPTPPPPVPPEPHTHPEITKDITDLQAWFGALEERVTALEQQPAPPPPAPVTVFQVTASVANARKISGYNQASPPRPIMAIYEPRVQYHTGETVPVEPVMILADGGGRYAKLKPSPVTSTELYLRMVDGVLVS